MLFSQSEAAATCNRQPFPIFASPDAAPSRPGARKGGCTALSAPPPLRRALSSCFPSFLMCTHTRAGPGGVTWLSYGGTHGGPAGSCAAWIRQYIGIKKEKRTRARTSSTRRGARGSFPERGGGGGEERKESTSSRFGGAIRGSSAIGLVLPYHSDIPRTERRNFY